MDKIRLIIFILFISLGFAHKPSNRNGLLEFNQIKSPSCMEHCLQCRNGPNSCTKCTEGADCCNWACLECQNQITCKNCIDGFRLDEKLNICVYESPCNEFCEECDDSGLVCLQCDDGYFLNQEMQDCQKCAPKCFICQSPDNCTICKQKTYLENGLCIDCQQHCQACFNATRCVLCEQSYYINQSGMCQNCIDHCYKCTSGNDCQACEYMFYYDAVENKCLSCPEGCTSCKNQKQCLTCESESGYYYNKTSKTCQRCSQFYPHCIDCLNTSSLQTINAHSDVICTKCDEEYYVKDNLCVKCSQHCYQCITNASCLHCAQRYFINDSKLCQECKILYCLICEREDECSICQTGFYWNSAVSKSHCLKCPYGCRQCNQYTCRNCMYGLYLKNGNCYRCNSECRTCGSQPYECQACMPGFFKVEVNMGRCIKCAQPCLQCQNMTHCKSCIYGFYQEDGVCKKCEVQGCDLCKQAQEILSQNLTLHRLSKRKCIRCSPGYIMVNNSTCKKCMDGCLNCIALELCLQCRPGYAKKEDGTACLKCPQHSTFCSIDLQNQSLIDVSDCQEGYVRDKQINKCVPCLKNCRFCLQPNPQFCLDCFEGYYHIYQTQQCLPCISPCKTCSSQSQCLSCDIGYYMNEKDKCIKCGQGCEECQANGCFVCAEGYRLDMVGLKCDKCLVQNCLSCKSSLQQCDTCDHGYLYYHPSPNISTSLLSSNSQSPLCYRCDEQIQGCKSCQSPYLCTQCFNGLELVDLGDNSVRNSCALSSHEKSQVVYVVVIGMLAFMCLVLIGNYCCIVITRCKLSKKKVVKPNENQTLIQTSQQSISPIDIVINSSTSYGQKSSVFNSFTGIN